jgi:Holliday junction resolvase-like predicted endonuclease
MAEEYFFNTLNRDKKFANETFDRMKRNVSYDENDEEIECDILMINGKSTVLIEVKYNARVKNIKIEDLIARANVLKQIEMHKDHNIYLGVAAMSFNKKLAKELRQAGIATIHHTGKKMVLYDKEVKVF